MVEFRTLSNRTYYVQYQHNLFDPWITSLPAVTGNGTSIQWIDNGAPKTQSHPTTVPQRLPRAADAVTRSGVSEERRHFNGRSSEV